MRLIFVILSMVLTLSSSVRAQDVGRDSLRGLSGVKVVVDLANVGVLPLAESVLQTDIELRFRQAGIAVFSDTEQWAKAPGHPYFYANINVLRTPFVPELVAYACNLSLHQQVQRSGSQQMLDAATWSWGPFIGTSLARDSTALRNDVKDHLDRFINDWLAVNTKQR